ncbi:glycosyltransferase family 2 protein [Lactobacillus sp. LC28-10]|uniref:Glycosyltransferase family 2 protein n=1 Tax=Secundilactobacillus angelensis TaxID=2722706 RepID=A0ABX1KWK2_9LACO|nr:glycosyltransferase family A protein [Secundilactobacillus angelensis]MCH5463420.1 glycosyltransferase family 2 protein [Secundilactobacillus angelensis]NLR18313.1 glycosyltransferase family 2 protein [Secundilactobacillus angelensis]
MILSFIIPTYNVENYIIRCLDSIVSQRTHDIEIIVVDDFSVDNTVEKVRFYSSIHKNVKLIEMNENVGVSEARNRAIQEAQGDFIYFVDGDDYLAQDALEEFKDPLQLEKKKIDLIVTDCDIVDEQGTKLKKDVVGLQDHSFPNGVYSNNKALEFLFCGEIFHLPFLNIVRRKVLIDNSIQFPAGRKFSEDMATTYKEIFYSQNVLILPIRKYKYVQRKSSVTNSNNGQYSFDYLNTIEEIKKFIGRNAPELMTAANYYTFIRLIRAYTIQCKLDSYHKNKRLMKKIKAMIQQQSKSINFFKLGKKDRIKIVFLKMGVLHFLYKIGCI